VSGLLAVVQDALARIVRVIEALEDGETGIAGAILRDLEDDLAAVIERERSA
jgi:hypothetical protein